VRAAAGARPDGLVAQLGHPLVAVMRVSVRLKPGPEYPDVDQVLDPRPFLAVDLQAVAKAGIPEPTLLFNRLLYRGMLHSLAGPPDCGKTTIALRAALELLREGETVVILDEEGGREVVAEKLLDLGATPADLDPERLIYIEFPTRTWDEHDRAGLWELLGRVQSALVLADSAGAFLAVAGQNENWAEHTIPFFKLLQQAARDHNTAVVVIDHIGKNEQATRYARGSGAKLQIADVACMVEAIRPFSRHQDGLLRLTITKDRRGHLHRHHEIKVITEAGSMALEISEVAAPADPALAGLPPADLKVLDALRETSTPATIRQIVDRIAAKHGHGLKRPTVSTALNRLADRSLVDSEGDTGKDKHWWGTTQGGVSGVSNPSA
jgi:AAA domain/Penicillinase repressor